MSEEKRKVKSRKRHSSKLMRWLHTEGRRYCAIALCASLILGNIGQMAAAADGDPDKEFELDRVALYEAVQEAVLGDPVEESSFSFTGDAADTYVRAMFEDGAPLYELKPEIEDNKGNLKLRIFAKLDGDVVLDDDVSAESGTTQLYEIDGSEEFYFLLTNTSTQEQTAVIRVGEKETELITVVPNSAVVKSEPEGKVAAENLVDAASLEKAGGGGGSSSGSGTTVSRTENETVQETAEAATEVIQPVETEAEKETQIAEESKADETSGALEETNAAETEEVKESEAVSGSDETKENEVISGSEASKENDTAQESGSTEESGAEQGDVNEDENQAEVSENAAGNSAAEENISDSASEDAGDTSSEDTGAEISIDNDTSSVEDSGNETVVSVIGEAAGISLHKTYRVATAKATASNATPSDAEEELASDSNAEKMLLEGKVYDAVRWGNDSAVLYVATAAELGVTDELSEMASPSDAVRVYVQELENIIVQVSAAEGILPEDAVLQVTEINEDGSLAYKYEQAKTALEKDGTQYTGMMALDISFYSGNNEVEPDGNVQVSIEMKTSMLPSNANLDTVSVQHLKEVDKGVLQVDQVADVAKETDGTVEIKKDSAVAEFSVDSFSTFVIIWGDYFTVNVHYVNVYGEAVNATTSGVKIQSGETLYLADFSDANSETALSYTGAHFGTYDGGVIESITASETQDVQTKSTTRTLDFMYGDRVIETLVQNEGDEAVVEDVYLVYQTSLVTPYLTSRAVSGLSRTKTVYLNEDGNYDLTLTVEGGVESTTSKKPMNILFIIDKSKSMKKNYSGNTTRFAVVKNAISNLIDVISENGNIDAWYSVVSFSSLNNTTVNLDWQNNASTAKNTVNGIQNSQGTNYQAGIIYGKNQLAKLEDLGDSEPHKTAETVVIFLTDGVPESYVIKNSNGSYSSGGNGGSDPSTTLQAQCVANAKAELETMNCDRFYAIGVGSDFSSTSSGTSQAVKNLEDMLTALPSTCTEKACYSATEPADLNAAFNAIAGSVTTYAFTDVTVQDPLSSNVQVVTDTDGKIQGFGIVVKNASGTVVAQSSMATVSGSITTATVTLEKTDLNKSGGTITAIYNAETKTITMDFPDSYQLEDGWSYSVTLTIEPSEAAYETYRANEGSETGTGYPNTGDAGTGTHQNENGFYSNDNDNAKVSYSYNGSEGTVYFDRPVVQINPGTLIVKKSIDVAGVDKTSTEYKNIQTALKDKLEFVVALKGPTATGYSSNTYKLSAFTYNATENIYELTIENLSPGTLYQVTETTSTAEIDSYTLTGTTVVYGDSTQMINGGDKDIVSITNTYQKNLNLTVKKLVSGNMGDRSATFKFTASVKRNGTEILSAGEQTFTLQDNIQNPTSSHVISDLHVGDIVTINEVDVESGYTTTVEVNGTANVSQADREYYSANGLTADTEIIFINEKNVITPTGLFTTKIPYMLMLAAAALGILGFTAADFKKRALKKREDD